jgi:hypothetical protein
MLKKHYLKELQLAKACSLGSRGPDVKKIQEWLNLWAYRTLGLPHLVVDGEFGPVTLAAVKAFAKNNKIKLAYSLSVDQEFFDRLSAPLKQAFSVNPESTSPWRNTLLTCARQHLAAGARETGANAGPWVRSYMNGQEGINWPWCAGFVQTIFDQALSFSGRRYTDLMPATFSCDVLAQHALKHNRLFRNKTLPQTISSVQPGDLFLLVRSAYDWEHVGIIEKVSGNVLYTIEGNTNQAGSREGIAVLRRMRNFTTSLIDIIRLPELSVSSL